MCGSCDAYDSNKHLKGMSDVQVSDEDDAAAAVNLADKLEAAIASELVLPEKHGLMPNQNNLLQVEIE